MDNLGKIPAVEPPEQASDTTNYRYGRAITGRERGACVQGQGYSAVVRRQSLSHMRTLIIHNHRNKEKYGMQSVFVGSEAVNMAHGRGQPITQHANAAAHDGGGSAPD